MIKSLADAIRALTDSNGMPPREVETFVRAYDYSEADAEHVFSLVDAVLFSSLASVLLDVAPRLDLTGYRFDTQPFFSLRRHTGKVIESLFDVVPALIRAGASPHETAAGESLAEWLCWYAHDNDATIFADRPRRTAALAIFEFAPSLENVRRPELLMYCIAHLAGERELRAVLARTGWDIDSSFGTRMMSGTATGRPALGIATGHHDLLAVNTLLRCGAAPDVLVYDYRRTHTMVPLTEYASHYHVEIRCALEAAFLDRQRTEAQSTSHVLDSLGL